MTNGPLADLRVLDVSDGIAGQFCGRLFADLGALVELVERPSGSSTRHRPPFSEERGSTLFWHLNLGKESIEIDWLSGAGQSALRAAVSATDVVLLEGSVLPDDITSESDDVVVCDFTPFGRDTSIAGWTGCELVYQAMAGTMIENGRPEREPLYGCGDRASYAAGVTGYIGALASLLARIHGARTRSRSIVDVAIAEVATSMNYNRVTQFSYNGTVAGRHTRETPRATLRCSDGWLNAFMSEERWMASLKALDAEEFAKDERFADQFARLRNWDQLLVELAEITRYCRVDELVAVGQANRALMARSYTLRELRSSEQLAARGFWRSVATKRGDRLVLGPMIPLQELPSPVPAPELGSSARLSHGASAMARLIQSERVVGADVRNSNSAAVALPLSGLRVIDVTSAWAGPMTTRILGYLGAEVIKIESPGRMDGWRGGVRGGPESWYPDFDRGLRPYNRSCLFNTQNHDKLGICVDLKSEAGREIVLRLVEHSDVVMANSLPGTLERLGLGYADVASQKNADIVMVNMPAYGSGGPISRYVALGPNMECMCGMASLVGYGDGEPITTGPAYMDPIGGFNGAAAVLSAVLVRALTTKGQFVELAQCEAAMHWIGEWALAAAESGRDWAPRGNLKDDFAPHDAFPTRGHDEWVVIAVESDAQWKTMCTTMMRPELVDESRFATNGARLAHERHLHAVISSWTRLQDKHEVARRLQEVGVKAAPIQVGRDLSASEFLRERGFLHNISHPEAGRHMYQGLPFHITEFDFRIRRAAPLFDEHTDEVLRRVAGLTDAQIGELRSTRVVCSSPLNVARPVSKDPS